MDLEEINNRLANGELLFCPECDLFHPETEMCDIIICANPFIGYSELEVEERTKETVKNFKHENNK